MIVCTKKKCHDNNNNNLATNIESNTLNKFNRIYLNVYGN